MLEFLERRWGDEVGKVYLATMSEGNPASFTRFFPEWPKGKASIAKGIRTWTAEGKDIFYCPSVFDIGASGPEKDFVKSVNCHWADFDGNAPTDWDAVSKEKEIPHPTEIVRSSADTNQHVYWFVERTSNIGTHEQTTKDLTILLSADASGWDSTQLLRIPGTKNYGYRGSEGARKEWFSGEPLTVETVYCVDDVLPVNTFSKIAKAEKEILSSIQISAVPPITTVLAFGKWTNEMLSLFNATTEQASNSNEFKRSGALQKLAYLGAENDFTDEQIFSILLDADSRWGKYTGRSEIQREKYLKESIAKARAKIGYVGFEESDIAKILRTLKGVEPEKIQSVFSLSAFMEVQYTFDWILKDFLSVGGFGLVVASPGVGKTRLTLQMAFELALGLPKVVAWNNPTETKRRVLYLSLEMAGPPLQRFVGNFAKHYDDMDTLSKNFFIYPAGRSIFMNTPEGQAMIKDLLGEYKPDVLIIDSLQRAVSCEITNELAMKDLTAFIQQIGLQYSVSVLLVHHNRKKSSDKNTVNTPSLDAAYGHQFLLAGTDVVLSLDKSDKAVLASEVKNRMAPERSRIRLVSNGIRFVEMTEEEEFVGDFNPIKGLQF